MQTNPNWRAFFIVTDPNPFDLRLQEILKQYDDPRLIYHHVDLAFRPVVRTVTVTVLCYTFSCFSCTSCVDVCMRILTVVCLFCFHFKNEQFTTVDAGYTTTDYVLDQLRKRKECKWLSATNGDNAYGSEVVDRILNAAPLQNSAEQADMLLLPMDSRNFADQGK